MLQHAGLSSHARLFSHQIAVLSSQRPLITAPLVSRRSITEMAEDVLVAAPENFAISGLSMGGIVAMEVARLAPERVAGMALMDTNHRAETDEVKARRTPQIEAVQNGGLRRVMHDEMKPNYLADGPNQGAILDLCMTMASDLGPVVFVDQSLALRDRRDQSDTLKAFAKPSLVLCGEYDTLCPPERHREMHGFLPQSSLQIVENAGHLPTLEQPEQTTAALMRWLEDL